MLSIGSTTANHGQQPGQRPQYLASPAGMPTQTSPRIFDQTLSKFIHIWDKAIKDVNSPDPDIISIENSWRTAWRKAQKNCDTKYPSARLLISKITIEAAKAAHEAAEKVWEASKKRTAANINKATSDLLSDRHNWEEIDVCAASIERDACNLMFKAALKAATSASEASATVSEERLTTCQSGSAGEAAANARAATGWDESVEKAEKLANKEVKDAQIVAQHTLNKASEAWNAAWNALVTLSQQKSNTLLINTNHFFKFANPK